MIPNNNFSILPFYTSLSKQNHRKDYAFGDIYGLATPTKSVLPFQIIRGTRTNTISEVILRREDGTLVENITSKMNSTGLSIVRYASLGYDIIVYTSSSLMDLTIEDGQYYIEVYDGVQRWYSDIFNSITYIGDYLKLEYWDEDNLVFINGLIDYTTSFRNVVYLPTQLGRPDYIFEDEVETRDGYEFPIVQISKKVFKFNFVAPEYLCDALRLVRMHDYIYITTMGDTYEVDKFLITPKWLDGGYYASVDAELECETNVKKIGKGYAVLPLPPTTQGPTTTVPPTTQGPTTTVPPTTQAPRTLAPTTQPPTTAIPNYGYLTIVWPDSVGTITINAVYIDDESRTINSYGDRGKYVLIPAARYGKRDIKVNVTASITGNNILGRDSGNNYLGSQTVTATTADYIFADAVLNPYVVANITILSATMTTLPPVTTTQAPTTTQTPTTQSPTTTEEPYGTFTIDWSGAAGSIIVPDDTLRLGGESGEVLELIGSTGTSKTFKILSASFGEKLLEAYISSSVTNNAISGKDSLNNNLGSYGMDTGYQVYTWYGGEFSATNNALITIILSE